MCVLYTDGVLHEPFVDRFGRVRHVDTAFEVGLCEDVREGCGMVDMETGVGGSVSFIRCWVQVWSHERYHTKKDAEGWYKQCSISSSDIDRCPQLMCKSRGVVWEVAQRQTSNASAQCPPALLVEVLARSVLAYMY